MTLLTYVMTLQANRSLPIVTDYIFSKCGLSDLTYVNAETAVRQMFCITVFNFSMIFVYIICLSLDVVVINHIFYLSLLNK